jgi:polar amino acid transport system substrate-binding protein
MNKLLSTLFIFIFSVSLSLNSQSQEILNRILESGELRVGMSGDQPPFSMTATDGSMFGLDVDMANGLADNIGVKARLIKMNFKDLIPALQAGKIDMIISGVTMTIERNKKVAFIGPYLISGNTVATKSKELAKAKSIQDIDKKDIKIAVMQGTTSEEFINANVSNATVFKSATNKLAMKLLVDGKVDVMVAGYPTIAVALLDNRTEGLLTIDHPMDYEPIGFAVAPSDPLLLNLVTNYFHALERTEILDLLKTKWFEEGSWILDVKIRVQD